MSNILTSSCAAEDVLTILSASHGTLGVDLFTNFEPDDPDDVVTIYDTGYSSPPMLDMCWERPTAQVRVRGRVGRHKDCKEKALLLMNALHNYVGAVGSIQYASIAVVNGPIALGADDRGRPRWVFNLGIQRTSV